MFKLNRAALLFAMLVIGTASVQMRADESASTPQLDNQLISVLQQFQFTGNMGSTVASRRGHDIGPDLARIGQLLWFDTITGLNDDNTCAGCHSPTNGFGDTQSIAIGIENNGIVGPDRKGPRNMRRTPMAINTAFFPNLMWNSRFSSLSGDPFNNIAGFKFPQPEGLSLSNLSHLLVAQAFIPPTERTEVAGFAFPGDNFAIRAEVLNRLNNVPGYRDLFGKVFSEVKNGAPITFDMVGAAIAEFEMTLVFADAPIDRFARGNSSAMTNQQKRGALLFFGKAGCVQCHQVSGESNEMFSDFKDHVAGTPQISPRVTNNSFDGPGANEDFGLEEISGDPADRYKFRTSPLRNVALQPAFFHNGAFTNLAGALAYHLDPIEGAEDYSPDHEDLAADLTGPLGPMRPVLARLDPLLATPVRLTSNEFDDLLAFVRDGLLDQRALPANLRSLIPSSVPSGRPLLRFQFPQR